MAAGGGRRRRQADVGGNHGGQSGRAIAGARQTHGMAGVAPAPFRHKAAADRPDTAHQGTPLHTDAAVQQMEKTSKRSLCVTAGIGYSALNKSTVEYFMKRLPALIPLVFVAACSSALPPVSPTLQPISGTDGNANVTGDVPSGGTPFTITGADGTSTAFSGVRDPALTQGTYGGVTVPGGATNGTYDVVAFSDDGLATSGQTSYVSATVIGLGQGAAGGFGQVARYSRTNTALLPVSGSGTYTGGYRATLGSASGSMVGSGVVAITGQLDLTANFAGTPTIGGSIKNRTLMLSTGNTAGAFNDITLQSVTISGTGTYSGTATGGGYIAGSGTTGSGTYQGLIGGTNGLWTAGAINLTHQIGTGSYTELGVYTGKRP